MINENRSLSFPNSFSISYKSGEILKLTAKKII